MLSVLGALHSFAARRHLLPEVALSAWLETMGGLGKPVVSDHIAPSRVVGEVSRSLSAAPALQPLGRVVRAARSGAQGRVVGRGWSARVPEIDGPMTDGSVAEAVDGSLSTKRRLRRPRTVTPDRASDIDLPPAEELPDVNVAAPTVKRVRVVDRPRTMDEQAKDALVPCLRKAAGLSSSTAMRSGSARLTATIVADAGAGSRAILLRCGP